MEIWKWFEGWLDDEEVCIGPISSHICQGSLFSTLGRSYKSMKNKKY